MSLRLWGPGLGEPPAPVLVRASCVTLGKDLPPRVLLLAAGGFLASWVLLEKEPEPETRTYTHLRTRTHTSFLQPSRHVSPPPIPPHAVLSTGNGGPAVTPGLPSPAVRPGAPFRLMHEGADNPSPPNEVLG